jgi:hypothetical protein
VTPEEVEELRSYWVGTAVWNDFDPPTPGKSVWIGGDIDVDGDSLVLKFRADGTDELLAIRFQNDSLPVPGIAYLGESIETPRDWYLDRQIALGEALDTGLLVRALHAPRQGWTELVVGPSEWTWEPTPRRSLMRVIKEWLGRDHSVVE